MKKYYSTSALLWVASLLIFFNSCVKIVQPKPPIKIGSSHQGGIVAYLLKNGEPGFDPNVPHGLIAAPSDQRHDCAWGCEWPWVQGSSSWHAGTPAILGKGRTESQEILARCSDTGIAARVCDDLVLNGYSDWYLPSMGELNLLYENEGKIGGFVGWWYYWSSTKAPGDNVAWMMNWIHALPDNALVGTKYAVRAVRTF